MVTATPPKTTRETWQDWLPDVEPTLTIDDVIERLKERGVEDVTVENIRLWQRENVLPAPIRRQVGTGKGGIRALYPPQAVEAITQIRALQDTGVRLRDMRNHLARMHPLSGHAAGTSSTSAELSVTTTSRIVPQSAAVSVDDPALLVAVEAAAKRQEQRTGAPIRQVTVTFTDTQDKEHSYVFGLNTGIECD